jgi:hypothetical protein
MGRFASQFKHKKKIIEVNNSKRTLTRGKLPKYRKKSGFRSTIN